MDNYDAVGETVDGLQKSKQKYYIKHFKPQVGTI